MLRVDAHLEHPAEAICLLRHIANQIEDYEALRQWIKEGLTDGDCRRLSDDKDVGGWFLSRGRPLAYLEIFDSNGPEGTTIRRRTAQELRQRYQHERWIKELDNWLDLCEERGVSSDYCSIGNHTFVYLGILYREETNR